MLAVETNEQYKALQHEIDFAQQEIQGNTTRFWKPWSTPTPRLPREGRGGGAQG